VWVVRIVLQPLGCLKRLVPFHFKRGLYDDLKSRELRKRTELFM